MSEFDDVIERGRKKPTEEESQKKQRIPNYADVGVDNESPKISLSSMLQDEPLLAELTNNINPELKTQVLIPLLNIVEKYGFAENLVASERTQSSLALMGVLSDVAPVLQGLSQYLEGHRNSLNDTDKEFLQNLQNLDSNEDLEGLFNSENELVVESPQKEHPLIGKLPEIDASKGKVDWMKIMDPEGIHSGNKTVTGNFTIDDELVFPKKDTPKIKLASVEELAAQAGVDLNAPKIQTPTNNNQSVEAIEMDIAPVNIDEFLEGSPQTTVENFDDSISQRFEAPQNYYDGTNGLEEDLQEAEPPIPSFDLPSARRTVVSKWQNFESTEEE